VSLSPGASAEVTLTVTPDVTAHAMGNHGVHVLATPFLIGLLENAGAEVMRPLFPAGGGSVGAMVEMRHLVATPAGLTVRARATLLETDGTRFLFAVEAWDDREKVAEGRHERYLIRDIQAFIARAMRKGHR
jgi:fluoroacetyl-CoA thioesterase